MTAPKELDYDYLSQWFYVDATSSSGLRWKQNCPLQGKTHKNFRFQHEEAGYKSKDYWKVSINGFTYTAARVVYCLLYGSISSLMVIDHIDGNKYNNVKENLRLITHKDNNRNRKKNANNSTGITGIMKVKIPNRVGGYNHYYRVVLILKNKKMIKSFNIGKLGDTIALKEAIAFKEAHMQVLKQDGYTERHGNE